MKSVEYDTKDADPTRLRCNIRRRISGKSSTTDKTVMRSYPENTVEQLKYIHAVYDLAKEYGDVSDSSYEALEQRWKDDNAERGEKVTKGEVIYGTEDSIPSSYIWTMRSVP